jgi:hypothetical protein
MNNKIIILLFALTCFSCSEKDTETPLPRRTVLIYMAADNNLYKNAKTDIDEMLSYAAPVNGNLLVYIDVPEWSSDESPQLLKIEQGKITTIKQYPQQNSASGAVLRKVIDDVTTMFAAQSYGLVLWSHGTGWLPQGVFETLNTKQSSALAQSFGKDNNHEMSITELAEALPIKFEYIIFDACLMGGIEVVYQLRNKAHVIIASPTETLVAGFPYNQILPHLFTDTPGYIEIATAYMDYYKSKSGILQTATIAVVSTQTLEAFAVTVKAAFANETTPVVPVLENIQSYNLSQPPVFYDLQDYLQNVISDKNSLANLQQLLSKIILYHDFTPCFLSELPIEKSCGLSVYISSGNDEMDMPYQLLDWYVDTL